MHSVQMFIFLFGSDVELLRARFAGREMSMDKINELFGKLRQLSDQEDEAGKASRPTKMPKHAGLKRPIARCITPRFCSVCEPDLSMALAMGLHTRLGEESPVGVLTADLLYAIIEMTRPKRQVPMWMSCDWHVKLEQRRRALAVLLSSRRAQSRRAHTTPDQASHTNPGT